MIRAFVALMLPESLTARLVAVQAGLPVGRAVEPDALHLTLAFLGEHQEPVIEEVHHGLTEIKGQAFSIAVDGLGISGDPPRALHARVRPNDGLSLLAGAVQRKAHEAGVALKRERFRPHITLARFAKGATSEKPGALEEFIAARAALRTAPAQIAAFALFRSYLRREGSVYERLAEYPLA